LAKVESSSDFSEPYQTKLTELHSLIQEELDELRPNPLLVEEPISSPPTVQSALSDSFAIDKMSTRAESATASALSAEEADIYEQMAQYILTQLMADRSAVLLFTSPRDGRGQTETLRSLSKSLVNHLRGEVFVLDALPNKGGMRQEKIPYISGDWGRCLNELKARYQLVLIDAPSLADVRTAPMLSQCDGVYLMIRLGYTTPYETCEAVRVIQQAGGRLLGSIAVE